MQDVTHVHRLITDYTLGLLPYAERQKVEQHTAACPDCRLALHREQQLGRLVRDSLQAAQPSPDLLRRLMPALPPRRAAPFFDRAWQTQLAALCVAFILLIGSAGLYTSSQPRGWRDSVPSFMAMTATTTREPTATLARVEATGVIEPTNTAVTGATGPALTETAAAATPSPAATTALPSPTATFTDFARAMPTPVAAILSLSN